MNAYEIAENAYASGYEKGRMDALTIPTAYWVYNHLRMIRKFGCIIVLFVIHPMQIRETFVRNVVQKWIWKQQRGFINVVHNFLGNIACFVWGLRRFYGE